MIPWSPVSGFLYSWGLLIAVVGFIATLVIIPIIVVLLPDDYFVRSTRAKHNQQQTSITRLILIFAKNIFGVGLGRQQRLDPYLHLLALILKITDDFAVDI